MPELPEIYCRAQEMNEHLVGKQIRSIEVRQPKCLNVPVETFKQRLVGSRLYGTTYRGKWLITTTSQGFMLINMGMGGELHLARRDSVPETWRVRLDLDADQVLVINFWWFGHTHYVELGELEQHTMTAKLGPNALDVTADELRERLAGRRARIKSFLLDQTNLAGIGNAYIHDILFQSKLHPLRTIPTLNDEAIERLSWAIREELRRSIDKGGASYETNLFGEAGGFSPEDLRVGYREGKPCPDCGTRVQKVKTGSTSSFICPQCQPLSS
jgi:formamidopyrimidine-DNA glycosylase